jgi:hypothetical protein
MAHPGLAFNSSDILAMTTRTNLIKSHQSHIYPIIDWTIIVSFPRFSEEMRDGTINRLLSWKGC